MQVKWEEMFGEKKEEIMEEVKVKKPRKMGVNNTSKSAAKTPLKETKKTSSKKKPALSKPAVKKSPSKTRAKPKAPAKRL